MALAHKAGSDLYDRMLTSIFAPCLPLHMRSSLTLWIAGPAFSPGYRRFPSGSAREAEG